MLPDRRVIVHVIPPVPADLLLFCIPGKLFRFLAMVRAIGISIRTALAGIRTLAADGFCHTVLLFHAS